MVKVKVHMRIAKGLNGRYHVQATRKASHEPLKDNNGWAYPTVAFALNLEIDDEEFQKAEKVLAEVQVPSGDVRILEPSVQAS